MIATLISMLCLIYAFIKILQILNLALNEKDSDQGKKHMMVGFILFIIWMVVSGWVIKIQFDKLPDRNKIICTEYKIEQLTFRVNDSITNVKYVITYKK